MTYRQFFACLGLPITASLALALPPLRFDGRVAGQKQIAAFVHPAGLKVDLWAADPMLASPVALCLDEKGRVFVAEEYRFNQGTEENRTRPFLLDDDLQINTVEDRLAMYQKWASKFDGGMNWFRKHSDQVRLLEDRTGKGRADYSSVFATGFNDPLDGLAAGLSARDGSLYFTCIPHLWQLKDTNGDGMADVRQSLHRGFGVNCAFLGHDLHGLAWGPDGKLYFSVGDRGFHVVTREGNTLHGPRTGGVFRCNADGTELEVIHRGLRNPQELAFDQYGNLFADDNNCDKGDHSRLVYVVEGGDSGWNMAYQSMPEPYLTGPWHAERMWHLPNPGQPAWIVPPVGKIGAGPSGFTFTSGLSLPDRYRNKFFYCNYTGNGGIEAFGVIPKGAGFEIVDHHDFLKPVMATDVDFGYDGKMYVADFVNLLWNGGTAGGRIYTLYDPQRIDDPVVREVKMLFAEGFRRLSDGELQKLLSHADQRVRQRAQFTLAERGEMALPLFKQTFTRSPHQLARLHAIWGLGQLASKQPKLAASLTELLKDGDAEIRAQAAKTIGECRWDGAGSELVELLRDPNLRVRYFAAMALGKSRYAPAVNAIHAMLDENGDKDPFLRHAGVMALSWIGRQPAVSIRARDVSPATRLAVLLVMRQWNDRRITQFLDDADLSIVTEAARAIHDLPMEEAYPQLATMLERHGANATPEAEPLLRRAIHAHFRLGAPANAVALARFIANERARPAMRLEALSALSDWLKPPPRDRVTGFWRTALPPRDPLSLRKQLESWVPVMLAKVGGKEQAEVLKVVARLDIKTDERTFANWVADARRDGASRAAALRFLASRNPAEFETSLAFAMKDGDPMLRSEALELLASIRPQEALPILQKVVHENGPLSERQRAFKVLSRLDGASEILDEWAERLIHGKVPAELQLDVLDALRERPVGKRKQALDAWETGHPASNLKAKFSVSLVGGDAERGRAIFVGHPAAQCMRCHTVGDTRNQSAGPDLAGVVQRNPTATREYLLESLLVPNARIAKGYASVALTLSNGKVIAGVITAEDQRQVTLTLPSGERRAVPVAEIEERTAPTSAMPEIGKVLTLREMRDLIEYLMTLK